MNKRVLIIEDNPVASRVQKITVENLGFAVDCAMTGEEGISLASQNKYSLILMDIGLPGMDGLETTEKIKAEQSEINNRLTPVVAITANEDPEMREMCLKAGMKDVFSKPFTPVTAKELLCRFCPEGAV